jgi:diacylglycerol O-acyltransferase / wax synthase
MRDTLGALDAAWLHLDAPDNPMVITAVLGFGGRLPHQALRDRIDDRMIATWPAFRRRVADPEARRPRWEEAPSFDIDDHLQRVRLPADRSLEDLTAELGSMPLDPSRPPWRLVVVDSDAGSAVIARFHHCLADGIALARVLLSVTDEGDPTPPAPPRSGGGLHLPSELPSLEPRALARALKLSAAAALELERLLTMAADPPTPLKGPLSGAKSCRWTPAIPLDRVKAIGRRHGGSVNDVLLASLAGAVRSELGPVHGVRAVRAFVPVDRRGGAPIPADLGNAFTTMLVSLPVGEAAPLDRLRAVEAEVSRLRRSQEPLVMAGLLDLFGHSPALIQRLATEIMGRKASMVVTNVPGPRQRQHLLGVPMEQVLVWVPQVGAIGVGVSLVSYAGEVRIGVAADRLRLQHPEVLAARVGEEITALDEA